MCGFLSGFGYFFGDFGVFWVVSVGLLRVLGLWVILAACGVLVWLGFSSLLPFGVLWVLGVALCVIGVGLWN